MVSLTRDPIDFAALTESVRLPHCGGVVLFLGTVRDITGDERTDFLDYESYPGMAEKKLAEVESEVRQKWPAVGGVALVHRVGRLGAGEVSVAVAVSAPHRVEAFAAARFAIDTIKSRVPIWKKDNAPDGKTTWVEGAT
ncbi:MAG TPA: molybdenum cofactor biosynthesis protein MoaE [Fimbriiglobus sp.]|jgi:molybdopterin synthase catalytic subunit